MHDAIAAITRLILAHSTLFLLYFYQVPIFLQKKKKNAGIIISVPIPATHCYVVTIATVDCTAIELAPAVLQPLASSTIGKPQQFPH